MTGPEVMNEDCLPPKETFYNSLKEEDIDDKSYAHAQHMCEKFGCNTMRDYHDLYLKLDVRYT